MVPSGSITLCRLIVDPPGAGARHMAVDEVLLATAAQSGRMSLRFYRWNQPTVSLGYFQSHADRAAHPASLEAPVVRRQTGGGAIVHDRELTYALAVPANYAGAGDAGRLYSVVHQAIARTLAAYGVDTRLCGAADSHPGPRQPFLCFLRRAPCDLFLGDAKIGGSAQRRRQGAILQHGSLLLGRSSAAPELPGINDLTDTSISPVELAERLAQELACELRLSLERQELSPAEQQAAARLVEEKYAANRWTQRR